MPESNLAERVRYLGGLLLARGLLAVTAESCTGGGIARRLTAVPGSSGWFERGYITYSNDAKREDLGVPAEMLEHHGAVSEATAAAMARGALARSHGGIGVAVTGIAGPDGGSADKPVGTVCFAWSLRDGDTRTARVVFEGDRAAVREQSERMAIEGLIDMLESHQE